MRRAGHADSLYLGSLAFLVLFGLLMLFSASSVTSYERFGESTYLFKQQFFSFLVGGVAFFVTYRLHYTFWKKIAVPLLVGSLTLLLAIFLPGLGATILGARRWISIGGFLFQPSEIVKLTFLIYLASWLERRDVRRRPTENLVPFLALLGVIALLIVVQPDLGTMMVITVIGISVYFIAGAPLRHFAWIGGIGSVLLYLLIVIAPYRASRLTAFLNPAADPQGIGYHITQSLLAIGSGGLFGLGLGHSRQKFHFLPAAESDSIFSIIAEELGFVLVVCFLALLLLLVTRAFRIAHHAPDRFAKFLAAGIASWFAFQSLLNVSALSGILPLTGIPLPFVSFGGSALVISLAAAGIVANISRHTSV